MQQLSRLFKITLGPALLLLAAVSLHGQAQNPSATVPIRAVVSVVGKNYSEPPKVTKEDVQVYDGKDKLTVSEWVPAQGDRGALDFAVVIDEETSTDLGLQLNDIKDFIKETPSGTRVAVFYAANGTVKIAQDFTADHEAAAKSVRLPLGNGGAYSSDYLSVIDLMKRWPASGARREMLLVADGIDRFRGDFPSSPDLDSAIARAQRSGIIIHTIFARGVGFIGRNFFRASLGQSNLSKIAEETGGEWVKVGQAGETFAEMIRRIRTRYMLAYHAPESEPGTFRHISVTLSPEAQKKYPTAEVHARGGYYAP